MTQSECFDDKGKMRWDEMSWERERERRKTKQQDFRLVFFDGWATLNFAVVYVIYLDFIFKSQ